MPPRKPSHDAGLAPSFRGFVAALQAGETRLVETYFVPGDQTILVRHGGMVVGFAAVVAAVRAEPLSAPGRLVQSHLREIGPDGTLITATHRTASGGQGVMTLLWQRTPDQGWRIASAHLEEPERALDPAVWQEAGSPLLPALGSGALDGLTIAVADVVRVAGHRAGPAAGAVPADRTAQALAELQQAGAAVVGLARTEGLGVGDTGQHTAGMPRNARAADRVPGGAMSGPTAAVALGQADLALGPDTGGSLLLPACYQGLAALRTSHGLVPLEGVAAIAPTFDTLGWAARDLQVLAAAAEVLLPRAGRRTVDEVLVAPALLGLADPDVRRAVEAVVERWDGSLLPMRMVDQETTRLEDWAGTYRDVRNAELADRYGAWASGHPEELGPEATAAIRSGQAMDTAQRRRAVRAQAAARAAVAELAGNGVLLVPTTATVAPTRDGTGAAARRGRERTRQLLAVATVGGLPAVTLPLTTRRRLPCGLSLVGPVGSDHALVDLAGRLVGGGLTAPS